MSSVDGRLKTFGLEKWYLDITTLSGEVFIGYAAEITWGKISLRYCGYLFKNDNNQVSSNSSFSNIYQPPRENSGHISWQTDFACGQWNAELSDIKTSLFFSELGEIDWHCIMPKSMAYLQFDKKQISGHGYVEKIKMTIPPWKIPIDQLLWGRYISEKNSIIWIQWKGPIPKSLVYFNGTSERQIMIEDEIIKFSNYELVFRSSFNLRDGAIGKTIFSTFKDIISLFPIRIFKLHERKFAGTATLKHSGATIDIGNYIHEIVDWK